MGLHHTFIRVLLVVALVIGAGIAKEEPTSWFVGAGAGAGLSKLDRKYADSIKHGLNMNWIGRADYSDSSIKDWGVNWEVLVGYKHWLVEWIGFRYYANVSGQHYKDDIFTAGKNQVGIIEYTANADLLINFYTGEVFSIGIFGGFGVGGAYFDSPAFKAYSQKWDGDNAGNFTEIPDLVANDGRYSGTGKVYKHHLSATISAGIRFNFFQKITARSGQRVCSRNNTGRQTCIASVAYLEHSFEFNAKMSLMTYKPTDPSDLLGGMGCYMQGNQCDNRIPEGYVAVFERPGYEVKNPYKFTFRYIIAF